MEAIVALVILALAGVGCLQLAQGASNLEYSATAWNAAVTAAESRMAQLGAGAPADANTQISTVDSARTNNIRVTREPWRSGLELITVTVPVAGEKRFVLRKIVANAAPRSASVSR